MGYTTEFRGGFKFDKPLDEKTKEFVNKLANTRRMKRKESTGFGVDNEFFVDGAGFMGQDYSEDVIDGNNSPSTQPGLWLQWIINDDDQLVWDGNEKFYKYTEWLVYLIEKVFKSAGYTLNGKVEYRGEEWEDRGEIEIKDNVVYLDGMKQEVPESMRTDVTWIPVPDTPQKAVLVTVNLMTRVVCDENATEEQILEIAQDQLYTKLHYEIAENVESIEPDLEMPYGSLENETAPAADVITDGEDISDVRF